MLIDLDLYNVNSRLFTGKILYLAILSLARGIIIILVIIFTYKKLKDEEPRVQFDIKLGIFLLAAILIFVGCINFLMLNLNNSLLIFSISTEVFEVWPKITLSNEDLFYQLVLIPLYLVITPIFEELIYRRTLIHALFRQRLGTGLIILISSLISAIPPLLLNLVEYSEEQAFWDLTIRLGSGMILALVFLRTQRSYTQFYLNFY